MSSLTFYVGEQPIDPIVVTVSDRKLDGLVPSLVGDIDLPAHTVSIKDSAKGQVSVVFTAPFTVAASVSVQVKLTNTAGEADLTDPFVIQVKDPAFGAAFTLLSPAQAEGITDTPVTGAQLLKAQALIGLFVDRDLDDPLALTRMRSKDLRLLRLAVAWQSSIAGADQLAANLPPGVTAVTDGDISMTFGGKNGGSVELGSMLAPLARIAVSRLSWMGMRSIHLSRTGRTRFSPLVSDAHHWSAIN